MIAKTGGGVTMGFLGSLINALLGAANRVSSDVERKSDAYSSGYDRGANKASNMSDDELRSKLKKAKENGISGWKSAGQVRAMADEYKSRNNK